MNPEIQIYMDQPSITGKEICDLLAFTIDQELTGAENKIWHAHPVWFLDGNPIVGTGNRNLTKMRFILSPNATLRKILPGICTEIRLFTAFIVSAVLTAEMPGRQVFSLVYVGHFRP